MPDSKEIQISQNKKNNLIIQATSGHYYNLAEYTNYVCWGLCAVSIFLSFDSDHTIIAFIIFVVDVLALLSEFMIITCTKKAGDLREQFDDRVIFGNDEREETERRRLKEIACKYSSRHKAKCLVQISNTGNDAPPGKKDWYTFSEEVEPIKAQIECIKQNKWWNDEIFNYGRVVIIVVHMVIISAIVAALIIIRPPIDRIINAAGVLVIRYIERVIQHYNYWKTTIKAETALDIVIEQPSLYGIKKCRELINDYRHISVFGCSIIHTFRAKKMAALYSSLTGKEE